MVTQRKVYKVLFFIELLNMESIVKLEKTGNLYHATPVWKVEYIFDDGLRADCGRKSTDGKPYQCLSPSIRVAADMAKITNERAFKETGYWVLGVIGFNIARLPESVRLQLENDPRLYDGLITYVDFPPESIDQVIVANLREGKPDKVIKRLCGSSRPPVLLHQIRYFSSDGKFGLME